MGVGRFRGKVKDDEFLGGVVELVLVSGALGLVQGAKVLVCVLRVLQPPDPDVVRDVPLLFEHAHHLLDSVQA